MGLELRAPGTGLHSSRSHRASHAGGHARDNAGGHRIGAHRTGAAPGEGREEGEERIGGAHLEARRSAATAHWNPT
jgi:hypothetical protein